MNHLPCVVGEVTCRSRDLPEGGPLSFRKQFAVIQEGDIFHICFHIFIFIKPKRYNISLSIMKRLFGPTAGLLNQAQINQDRF